MIDHSYMEDDECHKHLTNLDLKKEANVFVLEMIAGEFPTLIHITNSCYD